MTFQQPTPDGSPTGTPKQSVRDRIEKRVLDYICPHTGHTRTTQPVFTQWMGDRWADKDPYRTPYTWGLHCADEIPGIRAEVATQAMAKTMLATWIEAIIEAHDGVWFGNSDTQFTMGLKGRSPIKVDAPAWMTTLIRSYPKSKKPLSNKERAMIDHSEKLLHKRELERAELRRQFYAQQQQDQAS